jgi:hypothetical protein
MKSPRKSFRASLTTTPLAVLSIFVLASLSSVAFAQSDDMSTMKSVPPSDAQKSFDKLKTLAGSWEGQVTTIPPHPEMDGKQVHASLRVTSMGNALMHEMTGAGRPDDPITMVYLDNGRLLLTHYCDAGNRPRMTGKMSPDEKKLEFAFLDVAGSTQYGHMDHAAFNVIDANHHSEDWYCMEPGDKLVHAHMDLQRTK